MADLASSDHGPWLPPDRLELIRASVPLVYVEAIPVRTDDDGTITHVGLLLGAPRSERIERAIVSGRVMYLEPLREALKRNIEKDLGPLALPRIPYSPVPFTVRQYVPHTLDSSDPSLSYDPRQHAVALVYVVPIAGDVQIEGDCLGFDWFDIDDVRSPALADELASGHGEILAQLAATCR
ncbi:hypothetical protein BSZ39_04555 [Bowdeniella nasicola]|uniref:DUF4916 domain-containing protein n=1 Tax=Bowdeniella nasicola TaxID=208480 RepID=A0A1Q5Q3U5_9ACTO|nr:DUF4916 domain-containing protein [Bowdeniella nasicola]OKL54369.1 hypothetical protein BSZ39_04555 [Bowdeniella nasicola]